MKNITYISAGAGSGKTYSLTQILAELMEGSLKGFTKADPEKVILTTFTEKAASEFKERAKAFLFEKGLNKEALNLEHAMMGTIHGVANRFINKYWFHLGLSPRMSILLEEDVDFYISQSLAELPSEEELGRLRTFCDEFGLKTPYNPNVPQMPDYDYWKKELNSIISFSTNYGITDYDESCEQSVDFFRQFVKEGVTINRDPAYLNALLDAEASNVETHRESATKDERVRMLRVLRRNVETATLKWMKDFNGIPTATDARKQPVIGEFMEKFQDIYQSEYVFSIMEDHIRLVFDLARRWRDNYAAYKLKKRLLDFNDMEKYMYELLRIPEVAGEIADSFDYLFVDEFQDCSPIQVKIFDRLSDLVRHSWWVGDFKQAIYGFRGSDTELTKAVVDRIKTEEDGCSTQSLERSYRSLPAIVDFTNRAFTKTFEGVLSEKEITLEPVRSNESGVRSLRYFVSGGRTSADVCSDIVPHIQNLLERGVRAKDIAVLARTNRTLETIDEVLQNENIPSSRPGSSIIGDDVTILVQAILSLVMNDDDDLARATIAFLTQEGYGTGKVIDAKLEFDALDDKVERSYLDDVPMVRKILALRPALRHQSVSALVESLIIELDLHDLIRGWGEYRHSTAVLNTLEESAKQYEEHSIQMNLPATISGFADYLGLMDPACPGDENGVQLMTCHGAKGLEWKYVFLTSLDDDPSDTVKIMKREVFGVHAIHKAAPDKDNLFPDVYIIMCPWVYGQGNAKAPQAIADKVMSSALFESRRKTSLAEANRLLYVAVTRASDVLTLSLAGSDKAFLWPSAVGLTNAGSAPRNKDWDCFGTGNTFTEVDLDEEFEAPQAGDDLFIDNRMAVPFSGNTCCAPARYQQPSSQPDNGTAVELLSETGDRIALGKMDGHDMAEVGTCIHNIFCTVERQDSDAMTRIIDGAGLGAVIRNAWEISRAWSNLTGFLESRYGKATEVHHELPFSYASGGQIFNGSMDLVWKTDDGCVLVDFKTCPKGKAAIMDPEDKHYAGHYGGQFACYAKALEMHADKVLTKIVYYPVSGLIIELK